jgi:hypothetical protein
VVTGFNVEKPTHLATSCCSTANASPKHSEGIATCELASDGSAKHGQNLDGNHTEATGILECGYPPSPHLIRASLDG